MPVAHVNGIDICYVTAGDADRPCVLLVSGHGQQLVDWPEGLIDMFVGAGYFVVAFDNRDSGLSTHFHHDHTSASYSLDDMAIDSLDLIDALKLGSAHVLGISMGGMVAQLMALASPLVASLVLVSTNTGDPSVGQPTDAIRKTLLASSDTNDPVEAAVDSSARWASWELGMTHDVLRKRIERRMQRDADPFTATRQLTAIVNAPDRTAVLNQIEVPTVVIHGSEDPLIDPSGGRALAAAIPNAEFVVIDGLRHDLPPVVWPRLVAAVDQNRAAL